MVNQTKKTYYEWMKDYDERKISFFWAFPNAKYETEKAKQEKITEEEFSDRYRH